MRDPWGWVEFRGRRSGERSIDSGRVATAHLIGTVPSSTDRPPRRLAHGCGDHARRYPVQRDRRPPLGWGRGRAGTGTRAVRWGGRGRPVRPRAGSGRVVGWSGGVPGRAGGVSGGRADGDGGRASSRRAEPAEGGQAGGPRTARMARMRGMAGSHEVTVGARGAAVVRPVQTSSRPAHAATFHAPDFSPGVALVQSSWRGIVSCDRKHARGRACRATRLA